MFASKGRCIKKELHGDSTCNISGVVLLPTAAELWWNRAPHHKHPGDCPRVVNLKIQKTSTTSALAIGKCSHVIFNFPCCSNISLNMDVKGHTKMINMYLRGPQGTTWILLNTLDAKCLVSVQLHTPLQHMWEQIYHEDKDSTHFTVFSSVIQLTQ